MSLRPQEVQMLHPKCLNIWRPKRHPLSHCCCTMLYFMYLMHPAIAPSSLSPESLSLLSRSINLCLDFAGLLVVASVLMGLWWPTKVLNIWALHWLFSTILERQLSRPHDLVSSLIGVLKNIWLPWSRSVRDKRMRKILLLKIH